MSSQLPQVLDRAPDKSGKRPTCPDALPARSVYRDAVDERKDLPAMAPFQYLDHDADVRIRATGTTPEMAFEEAIRAMLEIQVDPASVRQIRQREFDVSGLDLEELLVTVLNEVLALAELEELVFSDARVFRIQRRGAEWTLRGRLVGEERGRTEHRLRSEVKAATWGGLQVEVEERETTLQCVLDL